MYNCTWRYTAGNWGLTITVQWPDNKEQHWKTFAIKTSILKINHSLREFLLKVYLQVATFKVSLLFTVSNLNHDDLPCVWIYFHCCCRNLNNSGMSICMVSLLYVLVGAPEIFLEFGNSFCTFHTGVVSLELCELFCGGQSSQTFFWTCCHKYHKLSGAIHETLHDLPTLRVWTF